MHEIVKNARFIQMSSFSEAILHVSCVVIHEIRLGLGIGNYHCYTLHRLTYDTQITMAISDKSIETETHTMSSSRTETRFDFHSLALLFILIRRFRFHSIRNSLHFVRFCSLVFFLLSRNFITL